MPKTNESTSPPTSSLSNPQYKGYHHMTWIVGNAKQAASYFTTRFGFRHIAYSGLETGARNVVSYVISNGGATFELKAPLRSPDATEPGTSEAAKREFADLHSHLSKHGDAVKDVAFEVSDATAIYAHAIENGAASVQEPTILSDSLGKVTTAVIKTYGDTTHTLITKHDYRGAFLPGYVPITTSDPIEAHLPPVTFEAIDHCVGNQDWGGVQSICAWYEKTLSFHRFWTVDDELLSQSYSSMKSVVMASPAPESVIKMPINEPAAGIRKSQIEEYVNYNAGPGVQHIAFRCADIVATVQNLRGRGVEFIDVPSTYYDHLRKRLLASSSPSAPNPLSPSLPPSPLPRRTWHIPPPLLASLQRLHILVDFDDAGYLLQIFTKPVLDRPTVFVEIIQRANFEGFGAGNFRALFEALEGEQGRRGNL